MLRQLDLCSGVGAGFPLAGFKLGGFELLGLCEIDPYCQDILGKRFPEVTIFKDVQELKEGGVYKSGEIDIITASPPCQPFSVQGKRLGADDERDCIPAVMEAIASIKPRFFAIEQVPGLLTCPFKPGYGSGSYFKILLGAIFECGYGVEWQNIGSGNFSSPFPRRRLLLVGVSNSVKLDWELPTPWAEQVRKSVEGNGSPKIRGVLESEVARSLVGYAAELAQPIGITSGNGVVRRQREAAGNSLDPRVAAIALQRIIYLNSEVTKYTSQSKDKLRHDTDESHSPEPENNGRSPSVRLRRAQDDDWLDNSPTSAESNSSPLTGSPQHQESKERSPSVRLRRAPELLQVNPHSLKPHPRNRSIYGKDEDISDLVEQIRRTAWIKPLVVNKQHQIISGHRRWKAALALGLETVPVEVREFESELDELEALLLENQYRESFSVTKCL
ncbi:MAG: DNA (cytosine-5-)-methyltransferase [Xenococcaceae cyanobacterium]